MSESGGPTLVDRGDGIALAAVAAPGRQPTVVFLPGYRSDMRGEKITALARVASGLGFATLRFDYSGHGLSEGQLADGTIGGWRDEALHLVDTQIDGPVVLVGSSMGGWIALLVAIARPDRVVSILGIAAAPDFTERQIAASLGTTEREQLMRDGILELGSDPSGSTSITRTLIEDGRAHLLLGPGAKLPIRCPVRLVHGRRDDVVPTDTALLVADAVEATDVRVTIVKDGDHRLLRPADLALLGRELRALLGAEHGA